MGFDEYFNIVHGMTPQEHYLSYAIGLAPRSTQIKYMDLSRVDLNKKAGPSSIAAVQLCAGMVATEAMRIILGKGGIKPAPHYFQFDSFRQVFKKGKLRYGNRNPIQKAKVWYVNKLLLKKTTGDVPKPKPPKWSNPSDQIPGDVVKYLVEMGTWATSADNCQPWKFEWNENRLLLKKDTERTGFFYDVNQESTFLTFGAVIENIRIAASHYGLATEVEYLPKGADDRVVTTIMFRFDSVDEDPLFPHLLNRCVNRSPYEKQGIPENILNLLVDREKRHPDIGINLISDGRKKKTFQEIIYKADRILFEDKRLHGGLFKWLRREIEPDGMGWDTLGLDYFQKKIFSLLYNWPTMNLLNKLGASRVSGLKSVKLLKSSPLYCLITIDEREPLKYIKGGEAMERFWVRASSLGFSLQPMAGFLFLLNHYHHDRAERFSRVHRTMIDDIHQLYQSLQIPGVDIPLFFFRMGFGKPQMFQNRRRDVMDVFS